MEPKLPLSFEIRHKNVVGRIHHILMKLKKIRNEISEFEGLRGNETKQSRHPQHCPNTIEYTFLACRSARSSLKKMAWAPVYSRFSSFSVFPDRTTITSHEGGGALLQVDAPQLAVEFIYCGA